jgi:hypothetical protein
VRQAKSDDRKQLGSVNASAAAWAAGAMPENLELSFGSAVFLTSLPASQQVALDRKSQASARAHRMRHYNKPVK